MLGKSFMKLDDALSNVTTATPVIQIKFNLSDMEVGVKEVKKLEDGVGEEEKKLYQKQNCFGGKVLTELIPFYNSLLDCFH